MAVTAIYELPVPIWVTSSALGKTSESGYGQVRFNVVMPEHQPPHGAPPAVDGIESRSELTDLNIEWASSQYGAFIPESLRPAALLFRVGLTNVTAPPHAYRACAGANDQLAEVIDGWFDHLRTWIEVVSGQDLDPRHRTYAAQSVGAGLTFIEPPHDGSLGLTIAQPRVRPIQAAEWTRVLTAVAIGADPPLEEVLSRDARAAQARGLNRRAIIDAATALEIVLGRHVRERAQQLSDKQRLRLSGGKVMLGEYTDIAKNAGIELAVPFDEIDRLRTLRNSAAHRGEAPGSRDSAQAVQTMIDFLAAHGPFRRSPSAEPDGSEWFLANSPELRSPD